jgi:RHS repeat-associated protein
VGGLLAVNDTANGVHFAAYDGNGNVTALVKAADGTISAQYKYGPFAESIRVTGIMGSTNPIRFSCKYTDDESDFLYYGHRYYNPSTGRWPNRDPIAERGGWNVYSFVGNSSPNYIDEFGLYGNPVSGPSGPVGPSVPDPVIFLPPHLQPPSDPGTQIPPAIDGLLKKGLEITMNSCFWRCYLLDLSDNDVQQMLNEIQNSAPLEERAFFQHWIAGIPGSVGNKFLTVAANIHNITARIPQGQGIVGGTLHRVTPREATIRLIRRKIYQQSVKAVGKNGVKYFGRIGSKFLPIVGWVSLGYEAAKACNCKIACKDDVFNENEKFIGQ